MKSKFWAIFSLLLTLTAIAQDNIVIPKADPSLCFTENKGQWDSKILYRSKFSGGTLYMERGGMMYDFYDKKTRFSYHLGGLGATKDPKIKAHAIKVEFIGCNPNFTNQHTDQGDYYENFYVGKDKSKWRGNVKNYHKVWYRNIYNNIDYEAITSIKGLKYNFYVKPGADPEIIKLKYTGASKIKLVKGELMIITTIDSIVEKKPYAYQNINGKIVEVPCKYHLHDNTVSFDFPKGYDKAYELVIDPILVFAAQSGSLADNFGMTATYDNNGNLYSGGTVFDVGYPTTPGAYDISFAGPPAFGNTDVVVTKYNATGTTLLFSTYLGGNGSEIVTSLIVDANNNVFLYGATGSNNFPTTTGAFDQTFNGGNYLYFMFNGTEFTNGTDIFVSKFNPTGTALLGSTYVGGSDNDGVNYTNALITYTVAYSGTYTPGGSTSTSPCVATGGNFTLNEHKADSLQFNYGDQYRGEIQLDKNGNVYIASSSRSSDFPIVGGFDNSLGGKQDAVVLKFNTNLTNVVWSSYLGGTGNDAGYSLIVTDSLFTYVTGGTFSTDFPTVAGCYNTSYNGGKADGYIAKINPAGNAIVKATYIGTNDYDQSYFITSKKNSTDVYVYGQSAGNMPVTSGVFSVPNAHQFITRLDAQLSNINMSTTFGSGLPRIDISPSAFSVDNCGNIYISGWGGHLIYGPSLMNMPVTTGAFQTAPANGFDFYLMVLSANATSLLYGSYFGGACSPEHVDGGTSRFDPRGVIYQSVCAGCQNNEDFPVTPGAWPNSPTNHNKSNNCNNGVFKFDFQIKITNVNITTNTITGCQPLTVNFNNSTYTSGTFTWNFGGGNTNTTNINPSYTFTNSGTYTVALIVKDTSSCNKIDSSFTYITVYPKVTVAATATLVPCSDTVQYNGSALTSGTLTNFQWTFGGGSVSTSTLTNPINTYTTAGTYTAQLLAVNNYGCRDSVNVPITLTSIIPSVSGNTICAGATGTVGASGGTSYSWQPSATLNSPTVASPIANPTTTTIYSVTITNTITGCVKTLTTQIVVNPKPNANFTYSINSCGGGVQFTDQSASGITTWNWNLGNSQTSLVQNPYYFYPSGGNYNVSLIAGNAFGCTDTIVKPLTVPAPPTVSISPSQTICLGNYVTLNASGGFAYQWQPTVGLSNPNFASPIATPSTTTQYSVTISTLNNIGDTCKLMLTTTVNVLQLSTIPVAVGADPDTVIKGNSTVLTLTASPGAVASWYPQGSTTPWTGYTVTATPQHPTTYTVVISRGPCSETLTVHVEVIDDGCESSDVFIPNTFTPNGDGSNDLMMVRGYKVSEIYFAIYNRWGEMVFETTNKNEGWDGTYKGRPADVGVFGYYIKFTCYNGLKSFKKGNITLIR